MITTATLQWIYTDTFQLHRDIKALSSTCGQKQYLSHAMHGLLSQAQLGTFPDW